MSSYLFVSLLGRCTFLEVQTSEDGILTESLLDFQLCLLHTTLFVKLGLFFLTLLFQSLVLR